MRERKNADEAVAERLRSALAPGPDRGLADLAVVGEPLNWSDIIPAWPDDVDLDPAGVALPAPDSSSPAVGSLPASVSSSPAVGSPAAEGRFPAGSAWAAPPGRDVGRPQVEAAVSSGSERRVLPPPAWVLPEGDEPHPPIPSSPSTSDGVPYAWPAEPEEEPAGLSAAGAFGEERRFGWRAFDPGRRGVKALALVAVLVIVIAAFLAWRARPQVDSVDPPAFESAPPAGDTAGTGAAALTGATPDASQAAEVVVAVGGKVRHPGLVRLPAGARVADALNAAGGADPGVDVALLNLARKVVDGELILVGVTPPPGAVVPTGPAAGGTPAPGAPVNLNTATLSDLDALPGVGPVLAQRILDARDAQGGFKSVSDLRKVDGIGDARYEQLKDLVTV